MASSPASPTSKPATTFRKPGNYPPGHPLYQKPTADVAQPPASPSASTVKVYTPEEKMAIWTRLRKLAETHQKELLADIVSQHQIAKEAAGPLAGTLNMPDEEEKPADAGDAGVVGKPTEEVKEEKKENDNFFAVALNPGGIRHRSTQAALLNRARNRHLSSAEPAEPPKLEEALSTEGKIEPPEEQTTAAEQAHSMVAPPEEDEALPAPPQEEEEEEEAPLPQIPYYTSGESELDDDDDEEAPIDVNDVRAAPDELLRSFPKTSAQQAPDPPAKLPSGNSNVAHLATSTEIRENQKVAGRRVAPQLESFKSVPVDQIEKMIKSFGGLVVEAANSQPPARQRAVTLIEAQDASEAKSLSVMANQELASLETNSMDAGGDDEAQANKKQLCVRLFFQRNKDRVSTRLINVDDTTRFEDLLAKVHAKATPAQAQTPEQQIKLVHIREIEKEIDAVCWLRKELEEQQPNSTQRKKIRETHAKLEALGHILASLKVDLTHEDEDPIADAEMLGMYVRGVKAKKGQWLVAGDNPLHILEQFQKDGDRPVLVYARRKVNLTISINQDVGVSAEAVVKFESFTFESSLVSEEAVTAVVKLLGMAPQSANLLNLQLLFPDTRWLEDGVPLYESIGFCPPASVSLSLRSRYFLERMDWVGSDPMAFQFIFSQAVQCVTSGYFNCSQLRATLFAALLVFVLSGSYSTVNSAGESEKQILRRYEDFLPTVLPQQYLATNQTVRVLAKDTRKAHELLGEFGTGKAMMAYLYLMKTGWMDSVRTSTKHKSKVEKAKPKQPGCYEFFCIGKTKSNTNQNLSAEIDVNEQSLVLKKLGSGFKPWSCALPISSLIGVEVPNKDQKLVRLYSFSLGSTDLTFNSTQERIAFSSCLQMAISKTVEIMNRPQGDMMMRMMTDAAIYQSLAFAQLNFDNHLAMKKRVSPPNTAKLSIFIGTFNCGSNGPDNMSWVEKGHDIYVWGVQECNYKPRKPHTTCENDWLACITSQLGNEYMVIKHLSMWEIRLVVMAKDVLMPFITNVEAGYEATGLGNVVKNKGGVAIAMTVFDTSIVFFNCHLAARPSKGRMKMRNKNMQAIFHSMATKLGFTHYDTLNSFDLVYILGDLNYRVTNQSREAILETIDAKKYFKLFPNDQLGQQRACGNIAFTFLEAPITFRPSYRYQADNPGWSIKKLFNLPSYCDRVMWQARPTVTVNPVAYRLHEDILGSDHRPVSSVHEVTVRTTVPKEPTDVRLCVVRLYGLTFDLFQKEKSLAAKRHVLRRLILTSHFLHEALEVHGECVDEDEKAGSTLHSSSGSSEGKKENDEEVIKREEMVTLLPMPNGFCHTSRFFADEIITFPLGDLAPRDIDTASLTLTMFLQGTSEPAGHAVIFLKDSGGIAGQTSAVPTSGYFTSDGLPLGCFSAAIVTAYGDA